MRLPNPNPVLDRNLAPTGSGILSSTGAGVWRNAPGAFSDSKSAPKKFQPANLLLVLEETHPSTHQGGHQNRTPPSSQGEKPADLRIGAETQILDIS